MEERELVNLSDRQITDSPGPFTPTSGQTAVCGRLCHGTICLIHDGGEKFSICYHGQRGDPDGGAVAILRFSINQMLLKSAPYNVSSHGEKSGNARTRTRSHNLIYTVSGGHGVL